MCLEVYGVHHPWDHGSRGYSNDDGEWAAQYNNINTGRTRQTKVPAPGGPKEPETRATWRAIPDRRHGMHSTGSDVL